MRRKIIVGLIISALFVFLAFRRADTNTLFRVLKEADYRVLLPASALMLSSLAIRAFRWRQLLLPLKRISFGQLYSVMSIGYLVNNIMPARLGELTRGILMGEWESISKSASFATVVVERVFDGLTVLGFFVVLMITRDLPLTDWLVRLLYGAVFFYGLAIAFLLLLHFKRGIAVATVSFVMRPFPERIERFVMNAIESFAGGLRVIQSLPRLFEVSLLSILVWLPNIFIIHIVLRSAGIILPFHVSVMLLVILSIGITIPSAPGFVGTIQYFCVIGLSIFAVQRDAALSFSLLYHAIIFFPLTLNGFICLFAKGITLRELRKEVGTAESGG